MSDESRARRQADNEALRKLAYQRKEDRVRIYNARKDGEEAEERFGQSMDSDFEAQISRMLGGGSLTRIQKELRNENPKLARQTGEIRRQIKRGNPRKARKIAKQVSNDVRQVRSSPSGCMVMIFVLGAVSTTGVVASTLLGHL